MKTAEEWVNDYSLLEKYWTNSSLVNLIEQVQQDARKELVEANKAANELLGAQAEANDLLVRRLTQRIEELETKLIICKVNH